MLRVRLSTPSRLTDDDVARWRQVQQTDSLQSPFYCIEYVQAVSAVRGHVEVAVLETDGGRVVGFLPFQRSRWNVAQPVGGRLCDFAGLVAPRDLTWSPAEVCRACGLSGWDFSGVPIHHTDLAPFTRLTGESLAIDLQDGFEAYCQHVQASGSRLLSGARQKVRKLEREVGPLRLEHGGRDDKAFALLLAWKSEQRRRTRTVNVLDFPWVRRLLDVVRTTDGPEFGGLMSVLYAGDEVAAIHFGLRSRTELHYWFPAYNRGLDKYSPGAILMFELVRAAAADGLRTITLGNADDEYKRRFASRVFTTATGSVDLTLARRMVNAVWYRAQATSHRSPAVASIVRPLKQLRRLGYAISSPIARALDREARST